MNQDIHIIDLTKRIVIGRNIIKDLSRYLPRTLKKEPKKAYIVTGPNVWSRHGKLLEESLEKAGFQYETYEARDAHTSTAEDIIEHARRFEPTVMMGFGGGKSIDLAKYCSSKLQKPFLSIPTAASHDGIASPFSSLKGSGKPTSIKTVEPALLLADIEIIVTSPKKLLIAGAGDTIAKITAVLDWRLAHLIRNEYYGEYAASLALLSAKHIIRYRDLIAKNPYQAARIILEALISSSVAMGIAGSTRPASGSEHLFSHALDLITEKPALHGEQTGVGTILMAKLHRIKWKKIRSVLKTIGAPVTSKELGVPEEKIIEALTIAHKIRPERYTILGDRGLTWEAAERLAMETGVIP